MEPTKTLEAKLQHYQVNLVKAKLTKALWSSG